MYRPYLPAATGLTLLVIYGSLVPFHFTAVSLSEAVSRFHALPYLAIGPDLRADWVANILLFIPVSFLWLGASAVDVRTVRTRARRAALVTVLAVCFAVVLEFTQTWFPPRTVSANDIVAESIGALVGTLLWLAFGQALTDWVRELFRTRRASDRVVRLLEIYVAGLVVYSVLPLDLTLSVSELARKLRDGRLVLLPFVDVTPDWQGLYGVVRDVLLFVPTGILLAVWRAPAHIRVRPLWQIASLGLALAATIEMLQVFVISRYATTTDCVLGGIGAAIGGAITTTRLPEAHGHDHVRLFRPQAGRVVLWALFTLASAVAIVIVFCAPFRIEGTPAEWRTRYETFWAVPFARLYSGTEYNAVSDVLRKLLLFGVFGGLATRMLRAIRLPPRVAGFFAAGVILAGATLAFFVELAQVALPPHVPDVTDVVLGGLGTTLGLLVMFTIERRDLSAGGDD